MLMSVHLTSGDSSNPRREVVLAFDGFIFMMPAISGMESTGPLLEQIDGGQEHKGKHQQHYRESYGAGVIELIQLNHDQVRGNLRFVSHVAGDENDRAVF